MIRLARFFRTSGSHARHKAVSGELPIPHARPEVNPR